MPDRFNELFFGDIEILILRHNELPKMFALDYILHALNLNALDEINVLDHLFFLNPRFRLQ